MKKLTGVALGIALLTGCAQSSGDALSSKDLEHRRYVLETVDGKPFAVSERQPDISFGENLHVAGSMCNRFMGQGKLDGNVLKVDGMASTQMLCAEPELNQLEGMMSQLLITGATVEVTPQSLTLKNHQHTLVYKQADWVN